MKDIDLIIYGDVFTDVLKQEASIKIVRVEDKEFNNQNEPHYK